VGQLIGLNTSCLLVRGPALAAAQGIIAQPGGHAVQPAARVEAAFTLDWFAVQTPKNSRARSSASSRSPVSRNRTATTRGQCSGRRPRNQARLGCYGIRFSRALL